MTKTVDLVYIDAGGGHRAAALALQEVIAEQQRPWLVRLVNLAEAIDPRGRFRKLTGMAPEDLYNKRLARGWTLGLAQELKLLQGVIRFGHATLLRSLQQHWLATEPDLVVSLVPNFNRVLYQSLRGTLPGVPYVTVLTDMADLPPHFWIEPGQDQYLVCGTPQAAAQARAAGYADRQIALTSGMILRPSFYRQAAVDRDAERCRLGLEPARPTAVVMFGGQGSAQMATIAKVLPELQLIQLCGHNQQLAARLRVLPRLAPQAVVGFTREVGRLMQLGDFFIGKPGPASLSEAVQMGLPVLTFDNAWTMPQERFNAQWVREQRLGLVLPSLRSLHAAVEELLEQLPEYRERVRGIDNRAVFEIPAMLAEWMHAAERAEPIEGLRLGRGAPALSSRR